jgi:YD repeat-containing protein
VPANELTKTTRPDTTTLVTDYNPDGSVADTIDGASNKTSYGYDGQARRTSRTDPDNRVWKTGYDKAGNQTSSTNPTNQTTSYGYDPANEPVRTNRSA